MVYISVPWASRWVAKLCLLCRARHKRHTFATRYLDHIYHQGKNPGAALPVLATYLGHSNINNTQTYLHPSLSLLKNAEERFLAYTKGGEHEEN